MKVQVIGLGTVGTAQAYLLNKLSHEVIGYDPEVKEAPSFVKVVDEPVSAEITFICTRESHVEKALLSLIENNVQGLYVIKSTTPPNTTRTLSQKYNVHICHNPEFLREKHAFRDVENPSRIVIGQCCRKHGQLLKALYLPLKKPICLTDPTTSEVIKLTANAHLCMLVSFWNEIHMLAVKLNLDTKTVAKAVTKDSRISVYGTRFFGKPFSGKCLPKDLRLLIRCYLEHGLQPKLLEAVNLVNCEAV